MFSSYPFVQFLHAVKLATTEECSKYIKIFNGKKRANMYLRLCEHYKRRRTADPIKFKEWQDSQTIEPYNPTTHFSYTYKCKNQHIYNHHHYSFLLSGKGPVEYIKSIGLKKTDKNVKELVNVLLRVKRAQKRNSVKTEKKWTDIEKNILIQCIKNDKKRNNGNFNWTAIAKKIGSKTNMQCRVKMNNLRMKGCI